MKRLSFCVTLLALVVALTLPVNAVDHETTLKALRSEIAATGGDYTVKYSPVCDIPIDELCTLKPEWAAASDIMLEDDFGWEKPEPEEVGEGLAGVQDLSSTSDFTGYCGSVRNQGSCGSCWAFGSVAAHEGGYAYQGGSSYNLSEQYLLDCNSSGYSCNGGWFVFYSSGLPQESCYPYVAYKKSCYTGCSKYAPISGAYYASGYPYPSVSTIKNRIQNYGGVAAAVYVNSSFQYYSSGCFTGCQNYSVNHAIYLCGWDDNRCGSTDLWRLKNSWGTSWGENGFMWIKYGCSRVGYAACYVVR
jgi:C1A family cysteine protease